PHTTSTLFQGELTPEGNRKYYGMGTQTGTPYSGSYTNGGAVELHRDNAGLTELVWHDTATGDVTIPFKLGQDGLIRGGMFFPGVLGGMPGQTAGMATCPWDNPPIF